MVVFAMKLTARRVAAGLLAACALVWGISAVTGRGEEAVSAAGEASIAQKLKTNEDRTAFLRGYGWEIDDTPVIETEVRIPETFDASYQSYNELQKAQGLDLERYKGKKAELYVYAVHNDPSGEEGVTASLLLYRDRLIAADISSAQADGFVRAVTERPAPAGEEKTETTEISP